MGMPQAAFNGCSSIFCGYGRPPYRLPGLRDDILSRKGSDSQQYDGFPFQNQSLDK
jgi:hypothetical protein